MTITKILRVLEWSFRQLSSPHIIYCNATIAHYMAAKHGLKGQRDPSPGQRRRKATPAPWVNMGNPLRPERAKDL